MMVLLRLKQQVNCIGASAVLMIHAMLNQA